MKPYAALFAVAVLAVGWIALVPAQADPEPLTVSVSPVFFNPVDGTEVTASGGVPPYTCTALPSPPNPAGVVVTGSNPWTVTCPTETEPGTRVSLRIQDNGTDIKFVHAQTR